MILTCPSCQQKYMVTNRSIGPAGRKVRCDNCQHQWFETPPPEDFSAKAPATNPMNGPTPSFSDQLASADFPQAQQGLPAQPDARGSQAFESDNDFATMMNRSPTEPGRDDSSDRFNFDDLAATKAVDDFSIPPAGRSPDRSDDPYGFDGQSSPPLEPGGFRSTPESLNDFPNDSQFDDSAFQNPAVQNKDSSVKKIVSKLGFNKSDTELEFDSMIKELDSEMSELNNLPDMDSLTKFSLASNIQEQRGANRKAKGAKRKRPRTGNWTVAAIVVCGLGLIFASGFYGRGVIVDWVPRLAVVYHQVGIDLPTKNIGLDFQEIHYDRQPGQSTMTISGKVVNLSNSPKPIPKLVATAYDGAGGQLKKWLLKPEAPIMMPGEQTEFSTPIDQIPPNTNEITIKFTAP